MLWRSTWDDGYRAWWWGRDEYLVWLFESSFPKMPQDQQEICASVTRQGTHEADYTPQIFQIFQQGIQTRFSLFIYCDFHDVHTLSRIVAAGECGEMNSKIPTGVLWSLQAWLISFSACVHHFSSAHSCTSNPVLNQNSNQCELNPLSRFVCCVILGASNLKIRKQPFGVEPKTAFSKNGTIHE